MEEREAWVVTVGGETYTWHKDWTGDIVVNAYSTVCIREYEDGYNIIDVKDDDKVLAGKFASVLSAIDYINEHYLNNMV